MTSNFLNNKPPDKVQLASSENVQYQSLVSVGHFNILFIKSSLFVCNFKNTFLISKEQQRLLIFYKIKKLQKVEKTSILTKINSIKA